MPVQAAGQSVHERLWLASSLALVAIGILNMSNAAAQSPASPSPLPAFDVASVHAVPDAPGSYRANLGTAVHGEVTLTNVTLAQAVRFAWGINNDDQIAGPDWIKSREFRYDIIAKAPPETPVPLLLAMLQNLLAERLKLVIHREQRQRVFLALVVARKGLKLQRSSDNITPSARREIAGTIINAMSMEHLTMLLSRFLHQPVLDMTGLTGSFDVNLRWSPETAGANPASSGANDSPATSPDSSPSISAALQEQLGLSLESRRGPLEVFVVDQASKTPLEN